MIYKTAVIVGIWLLIGLSVVDITERVQMKVCGTDHGNVTAGPEKVWKSFSIAALWPIWALIVDNSTSSCAPE